MTSSRATKPSRTTRTVTSRKPVTTSNVPIEVHPATLERFDDVASLLAPRDETAPACWCLTYRLTSSEFSALRGHERPAALRALCARETAPGVLAYIDGHPVGWCAFGPRGEMGRLRRSRTIPIVDDRPVWSIVCFVVRSGYRRRGVAQALLTGAIAYAKECGAQMLEAYPVDPGEHHISGTLAYVGTTRMFERAGFERIMETQGRSGGLVRWLMRFELPLEV
jgi:GNAT superfamily N-acetyltransferase